MRSTTKSFANEFGISQNNVSNNPSMGIGLNPNLNIQDEYIENLLKQTHFLNMEIKLIKEKQKENKGMGIMGLLNKDQEPVVTHAITSNAKYTEMKSNLASMVNAAEAHYIRLDDQNYAVKAQRDFAEKLSLKEQQKNFENKIYVDKTLGEMRQKLSEQQKKLKQLREQHRKTNDTYNRLRQEWEDITSKTKTKDLMKQIAGNLEKEHEALKEKHLETNLEKLKLHKDKHVEAYRHFEEDNDCVKLVEENNDLKEKILKSNKDLFDTCYRSKEMEELKKMSLRNKDVEIELKKQANEEAERLKKRLADKRTEFDVKLRESRNSLESNEQVRLIRGKVARKDKEIADLKKKTEITETNFKRLRDEVMKLTNALNTKKLSIKQKEERLNILKATQNQQNSVLRQSDLNYEKSQNDLQWTEGSLKDAKKRLESLQEQATYLTAKQQYLLKEIDMDEGIKNVKIEKLTNLMHSNSGLNETIGNLMTKWEQIIKFSREPPS